MIAFWIGIIKMFLVIGGIMTTVALLSWVERRGSGLIQDRLGPNRVGPFGLLQPVADGLKFLFKEEVIPAQAHKPLFLLAPILVFVPALVTFSVIPFGSTLELFSLKIPLIVADVPVGVLVVVAFSSLSVYGIILAGWSSGSKYPLLGGLRSSAQMISYELTLSLSLLAILMVSGDLRLHEVVQAQTGTFLGFLPRWHVFPQFLGFIAFLGAVFAETNRLPFDLPEAEAELVAGYHTEYSAMKFALFYLGEYAHMITASALLVTLYFGGWQIPYGDITDLWHGWASLLVFAIKVAIALWFFIWVRWTLPRFRYDQLMRLGWHVLLPLSMANLVFVGILMVKGVL